MRLGVIAVVSAAVGAASLWPFGDSGSASAQSSGVRSSEDLPTVRVVAPNRPRTARRAPPRTGNPQSVAAPAADGVPAPTSNAGVERANGPVNGIVARQSATGTKTDTPILETPQSIAVVPRQQIELQGAQSVAEAVRYTSGTQGQLYGAASVFDTEVRIRG